MSSLVLTNILAIIAVATILLTTSSAAPTYTVSKAGGFERRFDGIGGLSAGASSRLLADYDPVSYNQIMDYLFLPGFGAALHILKVEIGGDVQSTDGTESSHMHSANDENYQRGYEWALMMDAKRRNPNITLYGLSWGFPGWVGEGKMHPWTNSTVTYTVNWILGAKKYYDLDIDYIGIWNEKPWDRGYTLSLKAAITAAGLKTKIVGHDSWWNFCNALANDPEWAAAIDVISCHYPDAEIPPNCAALNKVQWASEDMSVDWAAKAACWTRELNQNYVRANFTATIAWAIINSFYDGLPGAGTGIFRAIEPWSGFYEIGQDLWSVAHWGQFTKLGWFFLQHGAGVGLLDNGGSYVSLTDPTGQELTIIVETMIRNKSECTGSRSITYNTTNQTATFQLDSSFAHVTQLFVFFSDLNTPDPNQSFIYKGIVKLDSGAFTLELPVGIVYTVSTINGTKGIYQPPPSMPFPLPYQDDFDRYPVSSEAAYFSDQSGSWEIVDTSSTRGKTMRQMVTETPISWCREAEAHYPYSIMGDPQWKQPLNISVDVMIETVGIAFVAVEVSKGGCRVGNPGSPGIVFSINTTNNGQWQLSANTALTDPVASGNITVIAGSWYTLALIVLTDHSEAYIDGILVGRCNLSVSTRSGFAAIGSSWNYVQFDNFRLQSAK